MFLSHNQDVRQQATASLAQTMRLMELTTTELADEVARELQNNPALQLLEEFRCATCGRRLRTPLCSTCLAQRSTSDDFPIVFVSPRAASSGYNDLDDEDTPPIERLPKLETLTENFLNQIACEINEVERLIAEQVLARLDERGLLRDHPAEIAQELLKVGVVVSIASVERVVKLIQRCEPAGVATSDLRECFMVQLEMLQENGKTHPLAKRLLTECWDQLLKLNYQVIAKQLHVRLLDVQAAIIFIRHNLTPYSGRAWHDVGRGGANPLAREVFYEPDIMINYNSRPGGPLMVEVFGGVNGTLRVDPAIKASLAQLNEEDKATWTEQIERASLLAKCVQQRNHTMRRLAEIITTEQKAFVLGCDADLKPMTRASLAIRLNLHESTVSRAVANKSVALPNGRMVPLSMFFDRSLAVRDAVHSLIKNEIRSEPLSDTEIVAKLKPHGYHIARRTVAKYRQMLGILPANLRGREFFFS